MKKVTYLLAVAAVFTACNSGNNGYTVTGTAVSYTHLAHPARIRRHQGLVRIPDSEEGNHKGELHAD